MRKFSITKKSIRLALFYVLFPPTIGYFLIGEIYSLLTEKKGMLQWIKETNTWIYFLFFILLLMIPTLYVFLEYLYLNRRTVVEFKDEDIVIISTAKIKYESKIENISKCLLIRETEGWAFHPASNFSMAKLEFKDGNSFIITCLLNWNLRDFFSGINFIEKRSIFPSILLYRVFKII
jgi:hypothetical protein